MVSLDQSADPCQRVGQVKSEVRVIRPIFIVLILSLSLVHCQVPDAGPVIGGGTSHNGPLPPKPTDDLASVLFDLAGWADLNDLIELTFDQGDRNDCARREGNQIKWACRDDKTRQRAGQLEIDESDNSKVEIKGTLNVVVNSHGVAVGTQTLWLKLTKLNRDRYAMSFINVTDYRIPKSGELAHYQATWTLLGELLLPDRQISGAWGNLKVQLKNDSGKKESSFESNISAKDSVVRLAECGALIGSFDYQPPGKDEISVISDLNSGVRKNAEGSKPIPWPTCESFRYGLVLSAPFWGTLAD